jgi:hypothetical protein
MFRSRLNGRANGGGNVEIAAAFDVDTDVGTVSRTVSCSEPTGKNRVLWRNVIARGGNAMLGNCVLRNPVRLDGTLDKGVFCESLLFFGKAHVVLDLGTLAAIVNSGFLDDAIEMMKAGYLTGNFSPQMPALYTNNTHGLREHFFTLIKLGGVEKKELRNPEALQLQLERLVSDAGKAKRYFRELRALISFHDLEDGEVGRLGRNDVSDPEFAREVARFALLRKGIPPEEIVFTFINILPLNENRFAISTDINFDKLRRFLPESDRAAFGQQDLFPVISDVRFDIRISASMNAALVGNEAHQTITNMLLQKTLGANFDPGKVQRQIYDYLSVATPSVREVINSGERTPAEFLQLMDKAETFRTWLAQQNPSADLVREMLREKTQVDWLESLPVKAVRFGLFTGGGMLADLAAPGSSVAIGAIDSFLIDRLKKHWRPHYFVENGLKRFLDSGN